MKQRITSITTFIILLLQSAHTLSMSLKEVIEHTLETNPEVRAAINEYDSRKYEVKQARGAYLPTVSVDAGIGHEERQAPATGNREVDLTRKELGLKASQLLFDGFGSVSEVRRQEARVEVAAHEVTVAKEQLALRTSQAYLDVLRHAEVLDLTRTTLWEHQNIYDQMKLRYDTGVGSKADFDQIEARLALANANMIVTQNNFADAQTSFHRLTGMYPTLETLSMPEMVLEMPANNDIALESALENHPTLLAANADMSAAKQQYKAAANAYYPRITLEADKRWDDDIGGIEGEDEDLIVAVRLRYDLFRGGANKARRKQTASLMEESKDIRNNSRRQVIESLNLSWNAFEAVTTQMQYLNKHVDAATSTREAYKKQFNIGRRTLLDLLNTENEVTDSTRALINAKYDQLYAYYRVMNSMGMLTKSF